MNIGTIQFRGKPLSSQIYSSCYCWCQAPKTCAIRLLVSRITSYPQWSVATTYDRSQLLAQSFFFGTAHTIRTCCPSLAPRSRTTPQGGVPMPIPLSPLLHTRPRNPCSRHAIFLLVMKFQNNVATHDAHVKSGCSTTTFQQQQMHSTERTEAPHLTRSMSLVQQVPRRLPQTPGHCPTVPQYASLASLACCLCLEGTIVMHVKQHNKSPHIAPLKAPADVAKPPSRFPRCHARGNCPLGTEDMRLLARAACNAAD